MKRVRHAKKEGKPLYKTHPNFDLDEDAEDEAKIVAQKFALLQGKGEGVAPVQEQTQMFADILKKYKKPEEPIAKYLDDFCKYKLYLAYFAVENTRDPPPIHPNDGEALVNDKQSIAAAFDGYAQFKKKLAKHKEETFALLDPTAPFNSELRQTKELHIVLRKRELVLGNGKHMTCANDDILHLYMAIHMILHFESYLAHLLDDLWTTLEQEIQGMTFCFIYEMFSPHFEPFRLIFQPPPR